MARPEGPTAAGRQVGGGSVRLAAAVLLAGASVAVLMVGGVAARVDLPIRDLVLRSARSFPAASTSVVAIDDDSLARVGPWPWPRARLAELVDRITKAEPHAVILDLLLLESDADDEVLARSLGSSPSVMIAAFDPSGRGWLRPPAGLRASSQLAHAVFELDHDGVLRRFVSTKQADGIALPAVSVRAASLAGRGRAIPVGQVLVPDFRVRAAAIRTVSAADILLSAGAPSEAVRGHLVFVGVTATGLGDRVVIPTVDGARPEAGVLVNACVTEAILQGRLLRVAPPLAAGLVAGLLTLAILFLARRGGAARLAASLALVIGPLVVGPLALIAFGLEFPFVTLALVGGVGVLAVELRRAHTTFDDAGRAVTSLGAAASARAAKALSPESRVRLLSELAREIQRQRESEAEARRVVAHELRTPLTSVRGLAQLLESFDLGPDERRRVAGMVSTEARRLQEMVDGLLELEQLALRNIRDHARRVDLHDLVAKRVAVLAAGTGRAIAFHAHEAVWVEGDAPLLERVVDNLLGNAVKFSPAEEPIDVSVDRGADGEATLAVSDRGPGVPAEERHVIFRRFQRGAAAAGTGGLGLGLALVREIVEWHGGRIEVESAPAAGSTFRVVLPQS